MPKPIRFAHAVLKTFDVPALTKWYCELLDARVVFQKGAAVSFITYDEEHHRLGFVALVGEPLKSDPRAPGLAHLAFTYANIFDLLKQYERLRDASVKPVFNINHGPTLSFYYQDPDGNNIELQVDRFVTAEDAQKFIDETFDRNPMGVECDPDDLVRRMYAGESEAQLLHYDHAAPIPNPTFIPIRVDEMLS